MECGKMLEKGGYVIKSLNTINFRKSIPCLQKHCIRRTISNIYLIFFCMVHWRNEKHLWQNRERRC